MDTVKMGRCGIVVNKNGFGALPLQRVDMTVACDILKKAYDNGVNYYDTARAYSDSESKLGVAFDKMRDKVIISTKTQAQDSKGFATDLDESLKTLRTDYIDIYQFHNPAFCPLPGGADGLYDAALKAKKDGKIRFIGITNHRLSVAAEAVHSALYDTLQFPFSYLADEKDLLLVEETRKADMGFIAMKALSGGLITNSAAAYAFMNEFPSVVPIWGIQKESELDEFISYQNNKPVLNDEMKALISSDKAELCGEFCRGCGYCVPTCPEGIQINNCARMSLMLRRAVTSEWLSEYWQKEMKKIESCRECGICREHCPYSLDTPALLKKNYEDYKGFLN